MTEEEKKAIVEFKKWIDYEKKNRRKINQADELIQIQETILNLIEKQEQEIKELKKHFKMATRIIEGYADEIEKDTLKIKNYRHKNIK